MDPKERLKLLYLTDVQSMNLDARLSRRVDDEQVRSQNAPVPAINNPGVSGNIPEFDFDPSRPLRMPDFPHTSLSYIRTRVIGILHEDDSYLTELDQDVDSTASSPAMNPNQQGPSDECNSDMSLLDVPGSSSIIFYPEIPNPTSFTSAVTMARYAIKYCSGEQAKIVSERFYDGDKFWNRTWDLYYLPVPQSVSNKPFLLIPTVQAKALLDEINSATNFRLTLKGTGKNGLVLDFTDAEREYFNPVFVGRPSSLEQKERLVARLPLPLDSWGDYPTEEKPVPLVTYQFKVTASVESIKAKPDKDAEKQAKKAKRDLATKKLEQCLGRVASYFGLRPLMKEGVQQPSFANGQIEPIDVRSPAMYLFHEMPIFISLDTEWMEGCHVLTEVGISVLDTQELEGVAPGDFGREWLSKIKTRHLRVSEHRRHVNSRYQRGCPDEFHHGKSEFIKSADIAQVVDDAFSPPPIIIYGRERKRTVIMVGLNLKGDIELLQRQKCQVFLDLDPSRPPPCSSAIHEVVDVAQLYRVYSGAPNAPGLGNLLQYLQVVGRDLHNAGNDAHHTLEALVRLMLEAAGEKPWSYEEAASKAAKNMTLSTTEAVQAPTEQDQAMMDTWEHE
ncbi:hypothetical protein N7452_005018 [Penicillium brevicompactum]|uniref:Gfd2/YDR514C-like C-terminal domain-containing protein n=1 Tax=Penicillium brevicompactum TaxID=5074 RepID=A0A9W9QJ59_PENBR|nr:hypothetical protein N7452_005018 [Penicillium brevicompactum]